jgi:hypothetical protein
MTRKHQSPEYQRNARVIRKRTDAQLATGAQLACWRCGRPIVKPYDVGHIHPNGGEHMSNLAPEHRTRTGVCAGNRNDGGRVGGLSTAAGKRAAQKRSDVTTWDV